MMHDSSAGLLDISQAVLFEHILLHLSLRDLACLSRSCAQLCISIAQAPAETWQRIAAARLPKRHPSLPLSLPGIRASVRQWHQTQQHLQAAQYTTLQVAGYRGADSEKCAAPFLSPTGQWLFASKLIKPPAGYVPAQFWPSFLHNTTTGQHEHELPMRAVFAACFWPCSSKVSVCYWEKLGKEGRVHTAAVYDMNSSSVTHSHTLGE